MKDSSPRRMSFGDRPGSSRSVLPCRTKVRASRYCAATAGGVIHKALWQIWRFTPTVSQPSGHDSEENLITLCSTCHASVHGDVG